MDQADMKPKGVIRAGRPEDGPAVADMLAALCRHEGKPPPAVSAESFARDGFGPNAHFWTLIAEDDTGETVGCVLFFPAYDAEAAEPGLMLADLFVRTLWRNQGYGRALMAGVAKAALGMKRSWIAWTAVPSNREAVTFYAGLRAEQSPSAPFWLGSSEIIALARE